MKKTMVTDATGVGANDFHVQENIFVLDDIMVRDVTEDKRGVIWALATGGKTSVKIHSTSKKIEPKWVIATSNQDVPAMYREMENGNAKEKVAIRGMRTRFMPIEFRKQFREENEENIQLDDARMELLVAVMQEIAERPMY